MTDINSTQPQGYFRLVPALATLPDGTVVGATAQQPALLTVHTSGYVTVHHQENGTIVPAFSSKLSGVWSPVPGSGAGLIPTEKGDLLFAQGPGCACGNPIKSFQAPNPGLA